VRIYSPAKTVADCFKYRNKIGAEIAVEALKDYLKQHPRGVDALWRFAKVCRVSNLMRPIWKRRVEKQGNMRSRGFCPSTPAQPRPATRRGLSDHASKPSL
jgi:hypothetical protein